MIRSSFTIYRHFCTRPLAVGGFVVRFRRFPCSCFFRRKVSTNFGPRVRGRLGGLGDFPPLAKRRELECVGLNEFTLLRQFVLRGGLVSFLLDFWQLSQDMVVIPPSREKRPGEGIILGMKQLRRSRVYDFASKTLQWCRSCLRRGFMRGWLPDNALNCDDASGRWRSRKRLRPQRAGIPCQSRMPHRPSSLERSLLPACRWPLRCRKAYR